MFKYAIFDADGTLFDSMYVWDNLAGRYLENRGIIPDKNLDDEIKGFSLNEASEYVINKYGLDISAEDALDEICKMIEYSYLNEVKIKQGVLSFLKKLKKSGVKMCIATSSDRKLIEGAAKINKISDFFDFMITSNEIGTGKSKPDIYFFALEKLGGNTKNTIVFEDAAHAAITAKNAGFKVCGVYDEFELNFPVNSVDYYIKSYDEAAEIF